VVGPGRYGRDAERSHGTCDRHRIAIIKYERVFRVLIITSRYSCSIVPPTISYIFSLPMSIHAHIRLPYKHSAVIYSVPSHEFNISTRFLHTLEGIAKVSKKCFYSHVSTWRVCLRIRFFRDYLGIIGIR